MRPYNLDSGDEQSPNLQKWLESDFYNSAVVLGITVGIQGIGVYLRKGLEEVFAKTLLFELPATARLEPRRQRRATRHARKNRARRRTRLRALMDKYGLPWVDDYALYKSDPFLLRYRAITGRLASPEALGICIRNIVDHRGFDYSAFAEEGAFPWGDGDSVKDVINWMNENFVDDATAADITAKVSQFDWKPADIDKFQESIKERIDWCRSNGIDENLAHYNSERKSNLRDAARRRNFPRTMVEQHLRTIISRHADLISDANGFMEELFFKAKTKEEKARAIFHYNRKTRAEAELLWQRRINKCPFAPALGFGNIRVSPNNDPSIGVWKALEFLATRRIEVAPKDGGQAWLHKPAPETISKLVALARQNRVLFSEKKKLTPWREAKALLLADVASEGGKGTKPIPDSSMNEAYFTQLEDIIKPTIANLRGNASISKEVAAKLFEIATGNGTDFRADNIITRLNDADYYIARQTASSTHVAIYPQVEFLLGRRIQKNGTFIQASTGRLQRLFRELSSKLDGAKAPDYTVVKVIRDAPRNQSEKMEILKAQIERRKDRETQFEARGILDSGKSSTRRRIALHHQQGGLSPYTGKTLPHPMDPSLEITHIFPKSRGGLSCDENLVLTFRGESVQKGNMTPKEAAASNLPGWLSWKDILNVTSIMRWGPKKRDVFAFEETPEVSIPNLGNDTRLSQLARQLVREAAAWMGVAGDAREERARVGTPSGWLVAQARKSWVDYESYSNVRSSLVSHLIEAAVLSHIPPAAGLNLTRFGGIFYNTKDGKTRAIRELQPSLEPWLKEAPVVCPIEKKRSNSKTRSLGDSTFWKILPPDEEGERSVRQRTAIDLSKFPDGEALHDMLTAMRIPKDKIPSVTALQDFLDRSKGEGAVDTTLRLLDGTPVRNVHKFDTKGGFTMPLGWSARPTSSGALQGAFILDGKFDRMEIWIGWNKRKSTWSYYTRLIPTKTALRHLHQTLPGWWKKNRLRVCGNLPPYARKVGCLKKGDQFLLPLGKDGKLSFDESILKWWFEVTSTSAAGVVTMKSISHKSTVGTLMEAAGDRALAQTASRPAMIAHIIGLSDPTEKALALGLKQPID